MSPPKIEDILYYRISLFLPTLPSDSGLKQLSLHCLKFLTARQAVTKIYLNGFTAQPYLSKGA